MSNILTKATIVVAGTTTVGGGAATIYLINNNTKAVKQTNTDTQNTSIGSTASTTKTAKKITALLKEKGLSILDSGNTSGWKTNWEKFKKDYESVDPKDDWEFENWEEIKLKTEDTSDLKNKCAENGNKDALNESNSLFQLVKKYCTNSPN